MQTSLPAGYVSLREDAAWFDLSARGRILARGEDRARLLHAMTTNRIEGLRPGEGCYAFFLNAQGRILSDANLLSAEDHILIDTEPETAGVLAAHLDKHIIADDVTIEDVRGAYCAIAIEGPRAAEALTRLGASVPALPLAHCRWDTRVVAALGATGQPGFRILAPANGKADLIARIEAASIAAASPEAVHVVRVENGRPRYGEDITDANLVQETQTARAISYDKGCYLGQGNCRARSRRAATSTACWCVWRSKATASPLPEPRCYRMQHRWGTSPRPRIHPALSRVVALGYVRADFAKKGAVLTVDGHRAEVTESRPD